MDHGRYDRDHVAGRGYVKSKISHFTFADFPSKPLCPKCLLEPNGSLQQLLCLSFSTSPPMYWAWMDAITVMIGDVAINVCKYLTKIYFAKYNLKQK